MAKTNPIIVTGGIVCTALAFSKARLDQLVDEGVIQRVAKGQYDLIDACARYVKYMRNEDRRSTKGAADVRVRDARAHEIEIRTAERMGRLVSVEDFDAMIDEIGGAFRAEIGGLPARVTRDLTLRRKIEVEGHAILNRVADVAIKNAARLEASRANPNAFAGDVSRRMGGEQSKLQGDRSASRPA